MVLPSMQSMVYYRYAQLLTLGVHQSWNTNIVTEYIVTELNSK